MLGYSVGSIYRNYMKPTEANVQEIKIITIPKKMSHIYRNIFCVYVVCIFYRVLLSCVYVFVLFIIGIGIVIPIPSAPRSGSPQLWR